MAIAHALIALLLFSKCLEATPVVPSPMNRPCIDLMLQVPATAQHAEYEHIHVRSDIDGKSSRRSCFPFEELQLEILHFDALTSSTGLD